MNYSKSLANNSLEVKESSITKIDWSKTTCHDDVLNIEDRLTGITLLMDGLSSFTHYSDSDDLYKTFDCINLILSKTIKDL